MLGIEHVISQNKREMTQRAMQTGSIYGSAYDAVRSGTPRPDGNGGTYNQQGEFQGFLRCGNPLEGNGLAP